MFVSTLESLYYDLLRVGFLIFRDFASLCQLFKVYVEFMRRDGFATGTSEESNFTTSPTSNENVSYSLVTGSFRGSEGELESSWNNSGCEVREGIWTENVSLLKDGVAQVFSQQTGRTMRKKQYLPLLCGGYFVRNIGVLFFRKIIKDVFILQLIVKGDNNEQNGSTIWNCNCKRC